VETLWAWSTMVLDRDCQHESARYRGDRDRSKHMEQVAWIIYKALTLNLNTKGIKEIKEEWQKIHWRRVYISIAIVFVAFSIGWILQRYYMVRIDREAAQLFRIVAQALVVLVPFVGAMVVFGFTRTDREKARIEDSYQYSRAFVDDFSNLTRGEELARNLMLKFSIYTFLLVIANLLLVIFSSQISSSKFFLAVLFGDVMATGYSFFLVLGIAGRILDSLRQVLRQP